MKKIFGLFIVALACASVAISISITSSQKSKDILYKKTFSPESNKLRQRKPSPVIAPRVEPGEMTIMPYIGEETQVITPTYPVRVEPGEITIMPYIGEQTQPMTTYPVRVEPGEMTIMPYIEEDDENEPIEKETTPILFD